jgi:putative transposon-encoded protein
MIASKPVYLRTIRRLSGALALSLMSQIGGCSKGEPITLTERDFLGTWIHKENAFGNDVRVDNRLLAFYDDSTVSYFRCTKRAGMSKKVSVPDSYISKLNGSELVVEADLFITTAKLKFRIDRHPFERDGDWFMQVDKVEFRKLHDGEPSDHESWPCFSEDQD